MTELYSPIDMDGIPWTEDLSNYIQDISITFSGPGQENTTALSPGETELLNLVIAEDGDYSFSINAVHPVTGELYTADVVNGGQHLYPEKGYSANISIACGARPLSIAKVMVLPTAVSFLSYRHEEPADIFIPTESPLITEILSNTVTIGIDDESDIYKYTPVGSVGLIRINGVTAVQGNLDIRGAGETVVAVDNA